MHFGSNFFLKSFVYKITVKSVKVLRDVEC